MTVAHIVLIAGRVLLALLFVTAGITKILGPKPVLDHMRQVGIPVFVFPFVIALEIAAGLAVMVGWQLPLAAGLLAVFCLATAVLVHRDFSQRAERTQFAKDLALAGALAFVAAV
ncbi:MAG TPA: DoxX family protein [Rhizomicrobium sp.]|nr:DoxX family protein [Rhizomicrobium sp.]